MQPCAKKIVVRVADDDDFRAYYDCDPPVIWLAMLGECEGRIVAMGGIEWNENGIARGFFDAKEKVRPLTVHRGALRILAVLRAQGEPVVYAGCDEVKANARRWLEKLGFVFDADLGSGQSRWKWGSG